jgi:uncharacterized repeat protein (TIGR03803 family)
MTQMTTGKWLMGQLSFVLPLLALGFGVTIASAQSGEAEAASATSVKFTTLYNFCSLAGCADGLSPSALILGTDGEFYGTTEAGGGYTGGTVFKVTRSGTLTTLYSFCSQGGVCTDGEVPVGLVQASNGEFYGATAYGGSFSGGTIFKVTPDGTLTTLYSFCAQPGCIDGSKPYAGLIQAADGDLYGTTITGGAFNSGTIFRITPSGTLKTLYSFCSQNGCADGSGPWGVLVQAANGDFYGTTTLGGMAGTTCGNDQCGTIFRISASGTFTTIYSFCSQAGCADGSNPFAGLVQATNGDLYGSTEFSGAGADCAVQGSCGTIFKITPSGTLTTLYSFCSKPGCADGNNPQAAFIEAPNGNLFGITVGHGTIGSSTIFRMSPSGTLTTLYSFCAQAGCPDGTEPLALVQGTNGTFYGTTLRGGTSAYGGYGTIFSFSTGQAPFIETRPTSGAVGKAVTILGYKLTGATSVTFNGKPAAFTIKSATEITTTVPAGATTGKVEVITPEGTLSSNVEFRVP